ncbi:MAG: hypothetical protein ACRCTM_16905 [Sphaerotilus sulfidivorans]|uniref:hypothetical protein n=1 Tax=Sphaerotilus sulfidivorans TaxID=639200 RepID=UPI003F3BFD51
MSGFKISSLSGVVTVISGKESADTLTGGDGADEVFGYGALLHKASGRALVD